MVFSTQEGDEAVIGTYRDEGTARQRFATVYGLANVRKAPRGPVCFTRGFHRGLRDRASIDVTDRDATEAGRFFAGFHVPGGSCCDDFEMPEGAVALQKQAAPRDSAEWLGRIDRSSERIMQVRPKATSGEWAQQQYIRP